MKTKIGILFLALCITFLNVHAQRRVVTTTRAMSSDISDNLDLDAVASIFGDSKDLEDFEYRLNDPDNRISNLDLNGDGYIDYLRVVENSSDLNSLVVIQAVLDQDVYQDVATIEIEKAHEGGLRVQVVGDPYIYGSNYIIEPVFVRTPIIFSFFWSSHYRPYYSPYYWGYYPRWYHYYTPYPTYKYNRFVYHHINTHNIYRHTSERNIHFSNDRYNRVSRNDFASRYPDRAFANRHEGLQNKYELERRRPTDNSSGRNRNMNNDSRIQNKRGVSSPVYDRPERTYENRRPSSTIESGNPGHGRVRENSNVESRRNSSDTKSLPVQVQPGNGNESNNGGSVTRSRSNPISNSNRSGNQVDSRNSTPREKSGSISNRSRVTREERQNKRQAESSNRDDKKETGRDRRR